MMGVATRTKPQPSGAADLSLQTFLPYRLAVTARAISNELAERYEKAFGISIPEWRVIAHLADVKSCSSGDICNRTCMDKSKVNRAVTRLEAAGLISANLDSSDRRLNSLCLTRRGRAVYDRIAPVALDVQAQLLSALGAAESSQILATLDKLETSIARIRSARLERDTTQGRGVKPRRKETDAP